jgi:phasin family protein
VRRNIHVCAMMTILRRFRSLKMNDTIKQIADKAQADGQAAFEKGKAAFGDMGELGRGNVEAMIESARVAGKGLETMAQQSAAYAKASFDKGAAAAKALTTVSSPTEFMTVHGDYLRAAFDDFMAEASRSTEAVVKLAGDVARPLQNRVAIATEKMKVAA